jgi:hypothetical protein
MPKNVLSMLAAAPTQAALLACLHDNLGHVVSYEQLGEVVGIHVREEAATACAATVREPHQ